MYIVVCRDCHLLGEFRKYKVGTCKAVLRRLGEEFRWVSSFLQMSWSVVSKKGKKRYMQYK